jgi:hypothetical protein
MLLKKNNKAKTITATINITVLLLFTPLAKIHLLLKRLAIQYKLYS